jgi:hypothetical protein
MTSLVDVYMRLAGKSECSTRSAPNILTILFHNGAIGVMAEIMDSLAQCSMKDFIRCCLGIILDFLDVGQWILIKYKIVFRFYVSYY